MMLKMLNFKTEIACDFYWQKTVGVITSVFNKPGEGKEEYSFLPPSFANNSIREEAA